MQTSSKIIVYCVLILLAGVTYRSLSKRITSINDSFISKAEDNITWVKATGMKARVNDIDCELELGFAQSGILRWRFAVIQPPVVALTNLATTNLATTNTELIVNENPLPPDTNNPVIDNGTNELLFK